MPAPEVPIEVDPETGVWSTDGLPMLYVPRHFFCNNHRAVETALGREAYDRQLYEAGYKSAYEWCRHEADAHGLAGIGVFHHYMKRLSQRGWGRFTVEAIEAAEGRAQVRVDHSVFVYHAGPNAGARVCYMFRGWFPGALAWVAESEGRALTLKSEEVQCAADGAAHCRFEVRPG